eukprot:NODE_846_length_3555_cov_0.991030.p3 type:complete len:268 gc:universal NODE_846_length_3555_cov_0.991030:1820-1017(-)
MLEPQSFEFAQTVKHFFYNSDGRVATWNILLKYAEQKLGKAKIKSKDREETLKHLKFVHLLPLHYIKKGKRFFIFLDTDYVPKNTVEKLKDLFKKDVVIPSVKEIKNIFEFVYKETLKSEKQICNIFNLPFRKRKMKLKVEDQLVRNVESQLILNAVSLRDNPSLEKVSITNTPSTGLIFPDNTFDANTKMVRTDSRFGDEGFKPSDIKKHNEETRQLYNPFDWMEYHIPIQPYEPVWYVENEAQGSQFDLGVHDLFYEFPLNTFDE